MEFMLALLLKYAVIVNNLKIKPNISLKKEKKHADQENWSMWLHALWLELVEPAVVNEWSLWSCTLLTVDCSYIDMLLPEVRCVCELSALYFLTNPDPVIHRDDIINRG